MFKNSNYENMSIQLHPGDRLVLYTDGITETRNTQGEHYGVERLSHFLCTRPKSDIDSLLTELFDTISAFSERAPIKDDQTLLILEINKE